MRLTEIFTGERQVTDAGKSQQTASAGNTQMSRQIRSLVPGQTIQGELINRNGNEVQIKLSDDMVLNAKLDQNMNLEIGKNMTFEVRNNGRTLTLSPLFENMATDATTLKALEMASLPVNNATVSMTKQLMEAGLPVDRNSLQQVFREINNFPQADVSDIVDLHKLSIPVTEESVVQAASYKNLTYQLVNGMNDVMQALPDTIQNMLQSGNVEGAARLYEELLALAGEIGEEGGIPDGEGLEGQGLLKDAAGENSIPGESLSKAEGQGMQSVENGIIQPRDGAAVENGQISQEAIISSQSQQAGGKGDALSQAMALLEELSQAENAGKGMQGGISENGGSPDGVITKENQAQTGGMAGTGDGVSQTAVSGEALLRELSAASGQTLSQDMTVSQLLHFAGLLLGKAVTEHDTRLIRNLLGGKELQGALSDSFRKLWTLKPEQVADPKQVEELYHRLDKQLKGIVQSLENAGQTSSEAFKAASNMSQNLDFLHQVNQMYTYVQLPLRLQQGNAHGDLYVYTNKKHLAAADGKVSALLHLDMEHLGPVDVYVALQNEKVSTKFYVQDDSMLDFLAEHMDILTERLRKRGYDCSCDMQVRGDKEAEESGQGGGINRLLAKEGHIALAQYAFDVRA